MRRARRDAEGPRRPDPMSSKTKPVEVFYDALEGDRGSIHPAPVHPSRPAFPAPGGWESCLFERLRLRTEGSEAISRRLLTVPKSFPSQVLGRSRHVI